MQKIRDILLTPDGFLLYQAIKVKCLNYPSLKIEIHSSPLLPRDTTFIYRFTNPDCVAMSLSPSFIPSIIFTILWSCLLKTIHMNETKWESVWSIWIAKPYEPHRLQIRTHRRQKNYLLCRCTATHTMTTTTNSGQTIATMHFDQTNHNNKQGVRPKWRMMYNNNKPKKKKTGVRLEF